MHPNRLPAGSVTLRRQARDRFESAGFRKHCPLDGLWLPGAGGGGGVQTRGAQRHRADLAAPRAPCQRPVCTLRTGRSHRRLGPTGDSAAGWCLSLHVRAPPPSAAAHSSQSRKLGSDTLSRVLGANGPFPLSGCSSSLCKINELAFCGWLGPCLLGHSLLEPSLRVTCHNLCQAPLVAQTTPGTTWREGTRRGCGHYWQVHPGPLRGRLHRVQSESSLSSVKSPGTQQHSASSYLHS